jgi:serine/threonine-protein kinase RsbW
MSEPKHVPPRCEFEQDKLVMKLDEVVSSDVVGIIDETVAKVMAVIERTGCWDDIENIDLALREALANAIIHGSVSDPAKSARICVALHKDCDMLIVVKDAGSGFDPSQLPNPVMGQSLLSTHGKGIYLINLLMEDVRFTFSQGTSIYMRRTAAPKPPDTN